MAEDLDPLFGAPLLDPAGRARNTDPSTSHDAAAAVTGHIDSGIIRVVAGGGIVRGVIWDDLRDAFPGVKETSISPRIIILEEAGKLHRAGDRRRGASGRGQRVIRIGPNPNPKK